LRPPVTSTSAKSSSHLRAGPREWPGVRAEAAGRRLHAGVHLGSLYGNSLGSPPVVTKSRKAVKLLSPCGDGLPGAASSMERSVFGPHGIRMERLAKSAKTAFRKCPWRVPPIRNSLFSCLCCTSCIAEVTSASGSDGRMSPIVSPAHLPIRRDWYPVNVPGGEFGAVPAFAAASATRSERCGD
jgi:hypothetical protein